MSSKRRPRPKLRLIIAVTIKYLLCESSLERCCARYANFKSDLVITRGTEVARQRSFSFKIPTQKYKAYQSDNTISFRGKLK